MKNDSRYPYTYACDFVRMKAGYGPEGLKMSRSEASIVRQEIAKAINMEDAKLAEALADHYLTNQQSIDEESTRRLLSIFR
jgi:hypothetical protein